jgi:plasmid stabilization system protein ParE
MSFPLCLRPEAEQDLADGRDWYDQQREGLGREFLDAVDAMFEHIRDNPELFAVEYKSVRRAMLTRFPYIVCYRVIDGKIEVIAVLHGSRNPRSWRSRAK